MVKKYDESLLDNPDVTIFITGFPSSLRDEKRAERLWAGHSFYHYHRKRVEALFISPIIVCHWQRIDGNPVPEHRFSAMQAQQRNVAYTEGSPLGAFCNTEHASA